ncbi:MAG TPA: hypothetical protein ENK67_03530 [Flavobacteriia bacterium]|nr:hypothetical protein [Flavobacteriia bacterium]
MQEKNYLKDIQEIKKIMNKSTKFLSLSGLTGILVGIYALIGAFIADNILKKHFTYSNNDSINPNSIKLELLLIAFLVAFTSIITAYILTKRKTKKERQSMWNPTVKRLVFYFTVPLITGGIFSLELLNLRFFGLIAPVTLIFYGIALISASNFTFSNIKYLGIAEIILGLIAMNYIGYGLYFWAVGFGVFHIIYGSIMYINENNHK